ncbi:MAG: metallophosphoesterase [Methylotenera sp.]|nr:metallophosphoesterase [Methylotenera sp.]MDD4927128.1 metallophosphoesterase [Methylotenera sp.]
MKFLLIHLSDIHIKSKDNLILNRAAQIASAMSGLDADIEGCILVITGDIAFSGQESEYALAESFISKVKDCLAKSVQIAEIQVVLAPGNHDCDFSSPNQVREIVISSLAKGSVGNVSAELAAQSLAVQDNYWKFSNRITGRTSENAPSEQLCCITQVNICDKTISFSAYNTAWMSQRNEIQGALHFPIEFIPIEDTASDLVVSLFHHPYNWLESSNAREFRTLIERNSDLIMTGHEHESGQYVKTDRVIGNTNEYVEGAVLQDSRTQDSGFNAVLIDLEQEAQKFFNATWTGKIYEVHAVHATWQNFQRNKNRTRNEYVISATWINYLTNPGAGFTNSRKEQLELEDIFVEPNLRELTRIDNLSQVIQLPIRGEQFWRRVIDTPHLAILGGESAGKTTLGKHLYSKFHAEGFVPITIPGAEFKVCDNDKIMKLVAKIVESQYSLAAVERYWQIESDKRVLLIDNYHLIALNNKGNNELFKHLKKFFGRIVLLTHDLSKVDELALEPGSQNPLASFIQFELQEFGNQLREELIERWFTVGQEFSISTEQLENQVIETKRVMDAMLGRNLLPAYPIFILIILQQIEAHTNLNTSSGALGYLYEHLITTSLAKTAKRLDLDTAHAYLSEIANHMFNLRTYRLNEPHMNEVHKKYCEDFKMDLRFDHIEKALINADLIANSGGIYSFKYKYCYYYFAARHLMGRLSTDEGKEQLRRLAENVHKEEFANILVFLAYLSKDPIIIEEMLKASRAIYPDEQLCDFDEQLKFINTLHDTVPKTVLIEKDAKSARKEINQTMDELEARMPTSDEDDNDLNDALRVNVAFKSIQILGQILKNHPGSILGPIKMEIAEECYLLGLRALHALYSVLEQHRDEMVEFIAHQMTRFEEDPDERIRKARVFVSLLVEGSAMAFVKKISSSIGTESLRQTYDELVAKHDRLAVKIIDLSVKLDHFEMFPSVDLDNLIEDVKKSNNMFATMLLKHLVFDHFYRYTIPRQTKQRYCEKLGIELKTVNLLDHKRAKL